MSELSEAPVSRPVRAGSEDMGLERWGWYSIAVNVILTGINLAVAMASGSLAVVAEMVHNLVDLLASVAVLVGLKLSTRKSQAFPYGLYKVENLVAAGLAMMIFFTAYEIGKRALLASPTSPVVSAWVLGGVALSLLIPFIFSFFELQAGERANSPSLVADAKEYRVHVLTSGVVLLALIFHRSPVPADRIAALVIVIVIAYTGWELLADSMRVLLDASLDADTLAHIQEVIQAEPTVARVKWVTGRNAGRFRFVEAGLELRVQDLARAEAISHRIEERIRDEVPFVDRVLIHVEPLARTHLRYAVPLADPGGELSPHFGEAPYFALVTIHLPDHRIVEQRVIPNPYLQVSRAKGIQVAEWLIQEKADVVLVKEVLQGKGPVYALGNAGVEVRITQANTLSDAMRDVQVAT
ncbi:MAG: cation diffusion facilitator family transporter [Anaerolineae bacterium]|nr:cation diffusion facilitator family transporter [Anaerolineae bacterium]